MSAEPQRAGAVMAELARGEMLIFESIWLAITRRPRIAEGAKGFAYHRPTLTILMIFMVLSAIEIPIIDMIVHRWVPVRVLMLAIGIWGLLWMIGLLCAFFVRPHTVGPEGIHVREGTRIDLFASWDDIESVRLHLTTPDMKSTDKPKRIFEQDGEMVCAIRASNETNIEIRFERPTALRLPGGPPKGGVHEVTLLQFWADEPKELLNEVRRYIG